MTLSELVTVLMGRDERRVHECRSCGATLVRAEDPCPYCGPTETATFECSD